MMRTRCLLMALACGFVVAGCAAPIKQPAGGNRPTSAPATQPGARAASSAKLTIDDPCATRLHDICGPLLLYYATHSRLPERVETLQQIPGFEAVGPYLCPVSNQPYIYNAQGLVGPNVSLRAVLYDAAPTHAGYRWAIVVQEPAGNAPLIAKVVAWAESRFPKTVPKVD